MCEFFLAMHNKPLQSNSSAYKRLIDMDRQEIEGDVFDELSCDLRETPRY